MLEQQQAKVGNVVYYTLREQHSRMHQHFHTSLPVSVQEALTHHAVMLLVITLGNLVLCASRLNTLRCNKRLGARVSDIQRERHLVLLL